MSRKVGRTKFNIYLLSGKGIASVYNQLALRLDKFFSFGVVIFDCLEYCNLIAWIASVLLSIFLTSSLSTRHVRPYFVEK